MLGTIKGGNSRIISLVLSKNKKTTPIKEKIIIGVVFLFLLNKDIIRELPPFIMPNTGNMGLPICLFAYGSQGLGVAAAISALIILSHFTLGIFLAARKFNFEVILKSPPFYTIIISVFLLYFEIKTPVFI